MRLATGFSTDSAARDATCEIRVNEQAFLVTENMFDALKELQSSQIVELLWIDAICIAQQDAMERAQQVSMMGRIYGAAEEVIVWLRKDETDIEEIKWAIGELLPMMKEQPNKYFKIGLLWDTDRLAEEYALAMASKLVGAMRFISSRRWFTRA